MAILLAFLLPVLIAFAAAAADVGVWYREYARLQLAADAGAYAAAFQLRNPALSDADLAGVAATEGLAATGGGTLIGSTGPGNALFRPSVVTDRTQQTVTVSLTQRAHGFFLPAPMLSVSATAQWKPRHVTAGNMCVVALDPFILSGIYVDVGGTVAGRGCGVASNARTLLPCLPVLPLDDDSIVVDSGTLTGSVITGYGASCIYHLFGPASVSPAPLVSPVVQPDPYAGMKAPAADLVHCQPVPLLPPAGSTVALKPGTYCLGLLLTGSGVTYNFEPGVYVVWNGSFAIAPGVQIGKATGVSFYLGGPLIGSVDWNLSGSRGCAFTAPDAGPYVGLLIWQNALLPLPNLITGRGTCVLSGAIYLPEGLLSVTGGAQLVAARTGWLNVFAHGIYAGGSGRLIASNGPIDAAASGQVLLLQ